MPKVSTSYKPGQSGNPKGRPKKGYSITEWFKEMLDSKPEVKDAIGKSILKKALEGDPAAQRMVWSYMDGMPKQSHEVSGRDGGPIEHADISPKERAEKALKKLKEQAKYLEDK